MRYPLHHRRHLPCGSHASTAAFAAFLSLGPFFGPQHCHALIELLFGVTVDWDEVFQFDTSKEARRHKFLARRDEEVEGRRKNRGDGERAIDSQGEQITLPEVLPLNSSPRTRADATSTDAEVATRDQDHDLQQEQTQSDGVGKDKQSNNIHNLDPQRGPADEKPSIQTSPASQVVRREAEGIAKGKDETPVRLKEDSSNTNSAAVEPPTVSSPSANTASNTTSQHVQTQRLRNTRKIESAEQEPIENAASALEVQENKQQTMKVKVSSASSRSSSAPPKIRSSTSVTRGGSGIWTGLERAGTGLGGYARQLSEQLQPHLETAGSVLAQQATHAISAASSGLASLWGVLQTSLDPSLFEGLRSSGFVSAVAAGFARLTAIGPSTILRAFQKYQDLQCTQWLPMAIAAAENANADQDHGNVYGHAAPEIHSPSPMIMPLTRTRVDDIFRGLAYAAAVYGTSSFGGLTMQEVFQAIANFDPSETSLRSSGTGTFPLSLEEVFHFEDPDGGSGKSISVLANTGTGLEITPVVAVFADHTNDAVVVALRGTSSARDALADLNYASKPIHKDAFTLADPLKWEEDRPSGLGKGARDPPNEHLIYVHKGMLQRAKHVSDRVLESVQLYLKKNEKFKKVILAGHSLGAGTAQFLFKMWDDRKVFDHDVQLLGYGYATPGSASAALKLPFDRFVTVVAGDDIVPRVNTPERITQVIDDSVTTIANHEVDLDGKVLWQEIQAAQSASLQPHNWVIRGGGDVVLFLPDDDNAKRLCAPSSKRHAGFWLQAEVGFKDIIFSNRALESHGVDNYKKKLERLRSQFTGQRQPQQQRPAMPYHDVGTAAHPDGPSGATGSLSTSAPSVPGLSVSDADPHAHKDSTGVRHSAPPSTLFDERPPPSRNEVAGSMPPADRPAAQYESSSSPLSLPARNTHRPSYHGQQLSEPVASQPRLHGDDPPRRPLRDITNNPPAASGPGRPEDLSGWPSALHPAPDATGKNPALIGEDYRAHPMLASSASTTDALNDATRRPAPVAPAASTDSPKYPNFSSVPRRSLEPSRAPGLVNTRRRQAHLTHPVPPAPKRPPHAPAGQQGPLVVPRRPGSKLAPRGEGGGRALQQRLGASAAGRDPVTLSSADSALRGQHHEHLSAGPAATRSQRVQGQHTIGGRPGSAAARGAARRPLGGRPRPASSKPAAAWGSHLPRPRPAHFQSHSGVTPGSISMDHHASGRAAMPHELPGRVSPLRRVSGVAPASRLATSRPAVRPGPLAPPSRAASATTGPRPKSAAARRSPPRSSATSQSSGRPATSIGMRATRAGAPPLVGGSPPHQFLTDDGYRGGDSLLESRSYPRKRTSGGRRKANTVNARTVQPSAHRLHYPYERSKYKTKNVRSTRSTSLRRRSRRRNSSPALPTEKGNFLNKRSMDHDYGSERNNTSHFFSKHP
ncbi:unnamed protein product [Amoebophrya sp. A120]|nr:unnamed protein product [Amoebophrya sp. A120]|eukprot:GSA120T00012337001.1